MISCPSCNAQHLNNPPVCTCGLVLYPAKRAAWPATVPRGSEAHEVKVALGGREHGGQRWKPVAAATLE